MTAWDLIRRAFVSADRVASLSRSDLPWLVGAILCGGVVGPVLLMVGLTTTPASSASLLLNLEGVLTALLAWSAFREHYDCRIVVGMAMIVAAGILLSLGEDFDGLPWGSLAIGGACLCWAIDNNLTRKISASDAVQIAGLKGLVAGSVNLSIALSLDAKWPPLPGMLLAGVIGLLGYGLSIVLFVIALRHLGTARTGAYFSAAPFVGAAVALILLQETPETSFWFAALLMAIGVWLHLSEHHEHAHRHEPMRHSHEHSHDEHHQHAHGPSWDGSEPHTQEHEHTPLLHVHRHFPDLHHRHGH